MQTGWVSRLSQVRACDLPVGAPEDPLLPSRGGDPEQEGEEHWAVRGAGQLHQDVLWGKTMRVSTHTETTAGVLRTGDRHMDGHGEGGCCGPNNHVIFLTTCLL